MKSYQMEIFLNNIIERRNEQVELIECFRVLWISREANVVTVISIKDEDDNDDENPLPEQRQLDAIEQDLLEGRCRKLENDPYMKFMVPEHVLSESAKKIRDEAWACIKDIVEIEPNIFNPKERFEMIKDVCEKTGKGRKFVYKYLRYYWIGGKVQNALLPRFHKCGGRGKPKNPQKKMGRPRRTIEISPEYSGISVTASIRTIFDAAISKFYNKRRKNSVRFAYTRMLAEFFNIDVQTNDKGEEIPIIPPEYKLPSINQFRYHLRTKHNRKDVTSAREGEVNFNKDFRPLLGSETLRTNRPGQEFQIDATVADVYLVSSEDPNKIIGRPVVYMVTDVFSHLVTGIYVGFEGPSWLGLMMAIENTNANKVEFCKEYGIDIEPDEWPCHHLPECFFADRGEMESKNADSLAKALGIKLKNAPPYRADLKGIVEQRFRTVNINLQPWMPGAVKKEYQKRGGLDYVLDAKLTLKDFTKMLIEMVLFHNNSKYMEHYPLNKAMVKDNVKPIPRDLWLWGISHDHSLKEIPQDIVMLNVLPEQNVTVDREGIHFQGMFFGSEVLNQKGWFIKGNSSKVTIAYDRRCLNYIYVKTDNGRQFIKCRLLEKSSRYKDLSLEEIKEMQHEEKIQRSLYRSSELQSEVEFQAKLDAIARAAEIKYEQNLDPTLTKTERKSNIKQNKKEERDSLRKTQYFELDNQSDEEEQMIDEELDLQNYLPKSKLAFLASLNTEDRKHG